MNAVLKNRHRSSESLNNVPRDPPLFVRWWRWEFDSGLSLYHSVLLYTYVCALCPLMAIQPNDVPCRGWPDLTVSVLEQAYLGASTSH